MKLAIVGSRKPALHSDMFMAHMDEWFNAEKRRDITHIVSGGAAGIDTQAEAYADLYGFKKRIIRPDYDKYAPQDAPKIRNGLIAEACDAAVVFWNRDPKSGTRNVLNHLKRLAKPTIIIYF